MSKLKKYLKQSTTIYRINKFYEKNLKIVNIYIVNYIVQSSRNIIRKKINFIKEFKNNEF